MISFTSWWCRAYTLNERWKLIMMPVRCTTYKYIKKKWNVCHMDRRKTAVVCYMAVWNFCILFRIDNFHMKIRAPAARFRNFSSYQSEERRKPNRYQGNQPSAQDAHSPIRAETMAKTNWWSGCYMADTQTRQRCIKEKHGNNNSTNNISNRWWRQTATENATERIGEEKKKQKRVATGGRRERRAREKASVTLTWKLNFVWLQIDDKCFSIHVNGTMLCKMPFN